MRKLRLPNLRLRRHIAIVGAGLATTLTTSAVFWWVLTSGPQTGGAFNETGTNELGKNIGGKEENTSEKTEATSGQSHVVATQRPSALAASIRKLQDVQSRIAAGDTSVTAAQRETLLEIEKNIANLSVEHAEPEDFMAATVYVLSGGKPAAVDQLINAKSIPPALHALMTGATHYVRGDLELASEKIARLASGQFPSFLGGHLAIAQARAVEALTYPQRREKLRIVTSTLPGTLLEEAALRRLIELAARHSDTTIFVRAALRHTRRFKNSLYGSEFRIAFIDGILTLDKAGKLPSNLDLDQLIFTQKYQQRFDLLKELSARALRRGSKPLCQYAAGRERRISLENGSDWTRATLFFLACGVVEQSRESVTQLQLLNVSGLSEEDRELHASALKLAKRALLFEPFVKNGELRKEVELAIPEETVTLYKSVNEKLEAATQIVTESMK
jgi:chemotaxis protein MotC